MKVLAYAGSFDPITLGHLDLIQRASVLCDKLVIIVSQSQNKKYHFNLEERVALVTEATQFIKNKEVNTCNILLAEYMKKKSYTYLLRGIRGLGDMSSEEAMSKINAELNPQLETIFLFANPQYKHISSSLVKELLPYSVNWKKFVPSCVVPSLVSGYLKNKNE